MCVRSFCRLCAMRTRCQAEARRLWKLARSAPKTALQSALQDVLQKCVAKMCCKNVLQKCVVKMCCILDVIALNSILRKHWWTVAVFRKEGITLSAVSQHCRKWSAASDSIRPPGGRSWTIGWCPIPIAGALMLNQVYLMYLWLRDLRDGCQMMSILILLFWVSCWSYCSLVSCSVWKWQVAGHRLQT